MLFFYGTRASHVHTSTPQATCLTCNTTSPHTLSTFGRYVHLYWIPLISIGKVSVSECQHCRVTHDEKAMPTQLRELASRQNQQVSAPFWHWTGLGLFGAAMLTAIVFNLISPEKSTAADRRNVVAAGTASEAGDEEVDEAYAEEIERRNDKAKPDAERAALAADPKAGDVYLFHLQKEAMSRPTQMRLTLLSLTDQGARCKTRTVVLTEDNDSTIVEQEITYPKVALVAMEKNGSIQTIIRNP